MSRAWQWYELAWHSPLAPAAAVAAMERLTTATELGPLVLELRAWSGGARWLVGCRPDRSAQLRKLLAHHLPVQVSPLERQRGSVDQVVRLQVRRDQVSADSERIMAATRALYATLSDLSGGQHVVLQLVIGRRLPSSFFTAPPAPGWRELLLGTSIQKPAARLATATDEQHGAMACLRLGVTGAPQQAHRLLSQVLGAMRTVETTQARFRFSADASDNLARATRPWRWPLRLRSGQLAAVCGWPIGEPPLLLLGDLHPRQLPPPEGLVQADRVIGQASAPGCRQLIAIPIHDAAFHTHLLGPTGTGKSTVLLSLALADVSAGRGVLLIDPKGDLAIDLLARIPVERHRDVVVIDPTNPAPVGLNPLAGPANLAPVTADGILGTLSALFREYWGIRSADVLSASLLTLARTPGANLLWLPPLLTDPSFRRRIVAAHDDPLGTGAFWAAYESKTPQAQAAEIAPALNKLRQLIMRPHLRAVLGQSAPRFAMADLFTRRRIVVVNLNRGLLGAEAARLVGSLLVSQLWTHLLARQAVPAERRHIVSIYIDEVHDFINGLPGDLSDALAQARSLGGAFHLAHQYQAQLTPAMVQAIDTNARNKIYFGLSSSDATAAAHLAPDLEAQDFLQLTAYHAYATVMQRGQSTGWMSIATRPAPPARQAPAALYAASHERYGVPATQTERELRALTGSGDPPDLQPRPPDEPSGPAPIGRRRREAP
nr:hypothetical protein [Actinomyces oris]